MTEKYPLRSIDDHNAYMLHKDITKELFGDLEEYAFVNIFSSNSKSFKILTNRFPYNYNLKHYVFFIHPKYEKFYNEERVKNIFGQHEIFIKSDLKRRSILTIKHYHFFKKF